jgi:hypothetical protein
MDNAQQHNICTNVPSSQILDLILFSVFVIFVSTTRCLGEAEWNRYLPNNFMSDLMLREILNCVNSYHSAPPCGKGLDIPC